MIENTSIADASTAGSGPPYDLESNFPECACSFKLGDMSASGLFERLAHFWCSFAHDEVMWPMHGQYRCRRCLRSHEVPWAKAESREQERLERTAAMRERSALY